MAKILKAETIETDLLGSNGNNALSLQRNSSSLLTLNTSDNVGIGTTVPTSKFEVKGSSNPGIALSSTDTTINTGGVFRINLTNASATLFEAGLISVKHSSSNQTLNAESSYISFSTRSTGAIGERMRIDYNGYVGIGTVSPAKKLDVVGNPDPVIRAYNNASTVGIEMGPESGLACLTTIGQTPLLLRTNSSVERLRIDGVNGNIGIGTTVPTSALDLGDGTGGKAITWGGSTGVNRSASIFTAYSSGALILSTNFHGSNATDTYLSSYGGTNSLSGIRLNGKSTNGIQFFTDSSVVQTIGTAVVPTERMRIDSSGNVGIGTASPACRLHLVAPDVQLRFTNGSSHVRHLGVVDADNSLRIARTGVADDVTINSSGNVGIGTTSPGQKLDVYGGVAARGTLFLGDGSSSVIRKLTASTPLTISNSGGSAEMTIDSSGNVGIGTTNPANRLEVIGSFGRGAPVTKTTDFTLAATENWIIVNKPAAICTVTLPAASSWTGREFTIKTLQAFAVVSATASSIVPRNSETAGTAILSAGAGNWATLVSNGTAWVIMRGS